MNRDLKTLPGYQNNKHITRARLALTCPPASYVQTKNVFQRKNWCPPPAHSHPLESSTRAPACIIILKPWYVSIHWFMQNTLLKASVALQMGSRSPKHTQLQGLSKRNICASLKGIKLMLEKYIIFSENFTYSTLHVTWSLRYNQFLRLSKWYIYASLAKNHPLVQRYPIYDYDHEKRSRSPKT